MAEVTMPRLSDTMEEGTIASWLKKPGDAVSKGEVLAQIETDKATMDLTAFEAGTLQEILAPEGATVAIGKPVARIGSGAATVAPPAAEATGSETPKTPEARANVAETPEPTDTTPAVPSAHAAQQASGTDRGAPSASESQQPSGTDRRGTPSGEGRQRSGPEGGETPDGGASNGKVRASPMARHIAAEHGLDLAHISGSGPQGRIIRADVEAALAAPEAVPQAPQQQQPSKPAATQADGDERVALSQMRRTIARRMAESTRTVPHFYLTTTVDATELSALRKQINDQTAEANGVKITFNDLIVKGTALAIRQVPEVNVSFAEDSLIRHSHVNVGIAVATERGLIVPVLRDADLKSLGAIARETRDLAEKANAGKLQPPDYSGGTFTVSNLGMFGVEQFQAVINPPESAILAVGAITREPAECHGEIALRDRLRLTLSVDHRALDGAVGARYLQALKALLEKPMLLLV
jgi:pyruvate dehydrogenase E2 component (dihydrolipoyllysine-residue acetyltransferase)